MKNREVHIPRPSLLVVFATCYPINYISIINNKKKQIGIRDSSTTGTTKALSMRKEPTVPHNPIGQAENTKSEN